jgi:hypothetical protein
VTTTRLILSIAASTMLSAHRVLRAAHNAKRAGRNAGPRAHKT